MRFIKQGFLQVLGAFFLLTTPVCAQEKIPSVDFTPEALKMGNEVGRFIMPERPEFAFSNPYLNDTLKLQYQNILLEKMIVRQGAIARTEKSFLSVGMPFHEPAPPRGICEQLPANVPCYKAYPELYPGAVAQVAQIGQEEGALTDEQMQPVAGASAPADKPVAQEKPPFDFDVYRWAEITCAAGQCRAVISYNGARRTVSVGDTVGDGVKITRITAMDVEASKDGKQEKLQAALAPSRGGASSPKYVSYSPSGMQNINLTGNSDQKAQQLETLFKKNADKDAKDEPPTDDVEKTSDAESDDDAPPAANIGGISDPGPPLGDTGLY